MEPFFWNDSDGDTGSIHLDPGSREIAVLEVQARDQRNAEAVWLTRRDAARLSAWLDAFVSSAERAA